MLATLLTVLVLAIVHLYAGTTAALGRQWRSRALSAASGVSVAYVFLDLMPDLAVQQILVDRAGLLPALDGHIYILAFVGLTVSLWVETASRESRRRRRALGEQDQTLPAGAALFNRIAWVCRATSELPVPSCLPSWRPSPPS